MWTSCGDNSFEISKAITQAKFLSGRYRTDTLLCHFGKTDTPQCALCHEFDGSIEHILVLCNALNQCRKNQFVALNDRSDISNLSKKIISDTYNKSVTDFTQLLLDCTVLPIIIEASQSKNGKSIQYEVLKFTRTWCFNMHAKRMKLLGRWRPSP